jgi:hypothetical protein
MTTMQPPTLLTLPTELRFKILKYAFILTCAPSIPPAIYPSALDIQLILPSEPRRSSHSPLQSHCDWDGCWGSQLFSNLFVINKKLYGDAIAVVYAGDFVFCIPIEAGVSEVRRWLEILGEKKALVKQVAMRVFVNLSFLSDGNVGMGIEMKKESIEILMRECKGAKTVWLGMDVMGNVRRGEEGRERVIEALLELFKMFRGKHGKIRIMGWAKEQGKTLLVECQKRRDKERSMEEEKSRRVK